MRTPIMALILLTGCSAAVSDLGGFTTDESACRGDGNANSVRDFHFAMTGMAAHVTQMVDIQVVERETHLARARMIIDPLDEVNPVLEVEDFVPPGDALEVYFIADLNENRMRDVAPVDHTWVRPVCSDADQYFAHIAEFEPVDGVVGPGDDFVVSLSNIPMALQEGMGRRGMVETRLYFEDEQRVVAVYRRYGVRDSVELRVEDIVDAGSPHVVFVFFDLDGDRAASDGDLMCGVRQTAPTSGPFSVELDITIAMRDGMCDLTALDAAQVR